MVKATIVGVEGHNGNIEIGSGDSIKFISNRATYPVYQYEYNGETIKT